MGVRIYQYVNLPQERGDDVHSDIVVFGGAMGLFGGKDKKDSKKNESTSSSPRKSRRIVAPGGKPAAPAAPATPANRSGSSANIKPAPPRPAAPAPAPAAPPAAPRPPTSRVVRQQPPAAPAAPMPDMITAPPRPKGKDPITAGSSRPPEFTGGLATAGRRDGPCRTGDSALLDFLQNKANLLDAGQVGQVRGEAETKNLQIDVAAVELGFITEEQMVNALTQECWVPHLKVDKYEIRKKALDTISREDATHFGVFPVDKLGSLLTLAMVNPLDVETIRILENKTSLDIKKVVATRTEIMQGIEKYYSGQVQAKDTSISFTQDIEPKSVTQMLSKVAPSAPPPAPPSRPMPTVTPVPAPTPTDNIVPEIQDIDDLLSSDEAIAPAIIEPISLKPEAFEAVSVEPIEMEPMEFEPVASAPAAPAHKAPSSEFDIGDAPFADEETLTPNMPEPAAPVAAEFEMDDASTDAVIPPMPAAPAAKAPSIAPEFEFNDSPAITPPAAKAPPVPPAPKAPPAAVPPPAAPPRPSPPPARAPAPAAKSPEAPKPATSRFTGTARSERSGIINLIPVTEDEFQHAITHGKSHVFEKWVGLQSRNRIINAVAVESEFDELLAGLYEGAIAV